MPRHQFTDSERAEALKKANSPEGIARRAASRKANATGDRAHALALHEWGMVDGAIATEIGVTEDTVARWLSGKRVRTKYGRGVIESQNGSGTPTLARPEIAAQCVYGTSSRA